MSELFSRAVVVKEGVSSLNVNELAAGGIIVEGITKLPGGEFTGDTIGLSVEASLALLETLVLWNKSLVAREELWEDADEEPPEEEEDEEPPEEEEPTYTARLENWRLDGFVIHGEIFEDLGGRFSDGTYVITSAVMSSSLDIRQGNIIRTRNSAYLLGLPERAESFPESDNEETENTMG